MLCQECHKNEANIHIIKSVDGKQTEEFLCEQCAGQREELDFSFEPQFSLHKLFASMLNQGILENRDAMLAAKSQCPECGLSFAQFSQVGRLGCSGCYGAFEDSLKPLLGRIHASSTHTGKIPARTQRRVRYKRDLEQLKEELQQKVQSEEFEEAAVLRDKIRAMEKDLDKDQKDDGEPRASKEDDSEEGDQN